MERQKCPLTLKEFSGGPSGGREEVASIKHGGRTKIKKTSLSYIIIKLLKESKDKISQKNELMLLIIRLKKTNHMIISVNTEKAFDKVHHLFMINALSRLGIGGNFHNFIKTSLQYYS